MLFLVDYISPIPRDTFWHQLIAWMDEYRDLRLLWNFMDLLLSLVFIMVFYYVIHLMSRWKKCSQEKHQKLTNQINEISQVQEFVMNHIREAEKKEKT